MMVIIDVDVEKVYFYIMIFVFPCTFSICCNFVLFVDHFMVTYINLLRYNFMRTYLNILNSCGLLYNSEN